MAKKTSTTSKKGAQVAQVVNAVVITESRELKPNVGQIVTTPKGKTFKVLAWQTALEHGMNANGTAFGSLMRIEENGKERKFLSNPATKKAEGYESLTEFYKEAGLNTSGQSGTGKEKKKPTFAEAFETLKSVVTGATDDEVANLLLFAQKVDGERRAAAEEKQKVVYFEY
jgi:hypothetical protein